MEIYETISRVSTNQVWLHINFASSRVYFKPSSASSSLYSPRQGCGPTCQKLPARIPRFPPHPFLSPPPRILALPSHASSSLSLPYLLRNLARLIRVYTVNPLSLLFFGIVYLNHPPTTTTTPSNTDRGAFLIAPRYV